MYSYNTPNILTDNQLKEQNTIVSHKHGITYKT